MEAALRSPFACPSIRPSVRPMRTCNCRLNTSECKRNAAARHRGNCNSMSVEDPGFCGGGLKSEWPSCSLKGREEVGVLLALFLSFIINKTVNACT